MSTGKEIGSEILSACVNWKLLTDFRSGLFSTLFLEEQIHSFILLWFLDFTKGILKINGFGWQEVLGCKANHLRMVAFLHVGAHETELLISFLKFNHPRVQLSKLILYGIADARNFWAPLTESRQLGERFICKEQKLKEMCLLTVKY